MSPAAKLRTAGPGDGAAIAALHLASQRAAYRGIVPAELIEHPDLAERTRDWEETLLAAAGPTFLLEDGGRLIGFCYARPSPDADLDSHITAEISNLHVSPTRRGRGHGSVLFATARRWAEGRFRDLTLWVLQENRPARDFYEKLGMAPDGAARTYHGSDVRVIRYRLTLSPPSDTHPLK